MPGHVANNDPFTVTFTFDEVVSGFATDDVTVTNGVLSNLTEKAGSNGVIYTAEVTPDGNGDVKVEVAANAVTDAAGNTGPAGAVSETAVYDAAAPTVTITLDPAAFNAASDTIEATFTFSEAVTGFDLTDVTVDGGTKPNTALTSSQNGAVYTGTFTATGNSGDLTVKVAADAATDSAGNTGPASEVRATAVRDTTGPTVTITGVPGHVANTNPFTVTFTFDEVVSGFATDDVTVTNGVLSNLTEKAGSNGVIYTAEVTPDGNGDVKVEVAANRVTDVAGNTGPAGAVSETAVYDADAPTLAITLAPAAFNSDGDAIEATFTFSKAVTGFDLTDVTVSGGTKPNTALTSSQNGAVYTGTFTATGGSGDLVVTVQANQATDAAGNTGPASEVRATATRDTTGPTVTITGVPGHVANTNPFTVTFTFDEVVSGFVAGDVTVSNGVLGTLTASAVQSEVGKVWSAPVTPNGDGDVDVTVLANAVTDAAGNTGPAADVSETAVYDAAAPTVTITLDPAAFNAASDTIEATFTFSEAVTGFDLADVTVDGGSKPNTALVSSQNGKVYTGTFTATGNSGDLTVKVAADAATDSAGNTGPASEVSETAVRDTTEPTVEITGVPGHVANNDPFTVTFTFDEVVSGFATDDVTVTNGVLSNLTEKAGSNGVIYTAEVTPDGNGDVKVEVAANRVTDVAGNTGPAGAVSETAVYDADAPTLAITLAPAAFNSDGDAIEATFTFSKAVTGFDLTDVTVSGGTKPNTALTSSQNGAVYTGTFTATGGSGDLVVTVQANQATDAAGNTGPASEVRATATRDTTGPTVTITGVPGHVANTNPFTVTFTFDEPVSGFVAGDVTVSNGVLGTLTASAVQSEVGKVWSAPVTPNGDGDVDVTVLANAVTDAAGNTGPAADVSETAVYDAAAPTVTITLDPAAFNAASDTIEATFTFSEAVTGFDLTDVTVDGGSKPNTALVSSQNGKVYTGTFTATGNSGDLTVKVAANAATDSAGNTGPASEVRATATRDTTGPTVTITGVPGHVANTNPFTVTFTFDEPVSGFVAGDVTVSNGVLGTLTASAVQSEVGKVWSAPVTPNGDGDVDVTVLANAVTDAAGNTGPAADVSETAVYDAAAPTEIVIETETVEETDTDYVVSAGALKVTVKVKRGTPAGIMLTLPEDIVSGIEITLSPSKHDVPLDAAGYGFGANMQDRTVVDVSSTGRLAHLCLPVSQALRTEAGDQDLVLLHHVRGAWKAEDSYTEAGRTRVCADDVTEFSPFAAAYKTNKTNTAPVFEQASHEFKLAENRIGPVELVTLTATDKDAGDTIAYALSAGDTNLFSIDETSGALSYIGPGEDFEIEPNRHDLTVSATDGGRLSATTAVTVTVINVNEAPVFEQASYEFKLAENRIGPVELVTLTATDKDAGDTIAYALSAGDTNLFSIDATSGALSYIGPGEDFESEPNRYDLTVSATDGERLSAEAEVTVTVTDEDEGAIARARLRRVNEAILPELSRAIVSGVVESVADRIEDARMRMAGDARLAIAGHPVGAAAADEEVLERIRLREARDRRHRWQETLDAETMDWKEALRGTSFALPLSGGDSVSPGGPGAVTVWGGGDRRALSGGDRGRPVEWDGDVVGARLGVDARLRDDLLAGLALSWSRGSFDWTDRSDAGDQEMKGTHGSEMTSLHPYVGWWSGEGASLWASLGYGRGDVEIEDDEAGRQTSDAALSTAAAGGRVLLFSGDGALPGGMTSLALRGETWLSRFEVEDNGDRMAGLTANTHRLRVGLEGAYERRLAGGGSLTPSLEVGVRHDGGDGETGLGVDLGGGLAWRDPALGLTVEGRARVLLIHRGDIGEWGASGSVRLDPGAGGLGLSFGLRPSWGAAAEGGVDRLWQDGPDSRLARAAANDNAETPSPAMGLEAELGYGMAAPGGHGVLTPYGGLSLSDGGSRSWRVGGRLAIGPSFTLGLEGERQESGDATPDHGVTLTGTVRW